MRWRSAVVAVGSAALLGVTGPVVAADTPTCMGEAATIVGTPHGDRLYGTPGRDVVWLGGTAFGGSDHFEGRAGDDLICQGGPGAGVIHAGPGDDVVQLDDHHGGLVRAFGDDGADHLVASVAGVLVGGDGDDLLEGGTGRDTLVGGDGDDEIIGGGGDDFVQEGPGSDDVDTGPGSDDVAYGERFYEDESGSGHDYVDHPVVIDVAAGTVQSGPDLDTVTGNEEWVATSMADTLLGSPGDDILHAGPGIAEDTVDAGDGDDVVTVSAGTVLSGAGDDEVGAVYPNYDDEPGFETSITVRAGPGDDLVRVDSFEMTAYGGSGRDALDLGRLHYNLNSRGAAIDVAAGRAHAPSHKFPATVSFEGFEAFWGTRFDDTFRGASGPDEFRGGAGDDAAKGGPGRDLLVGGAGDDDLEGGRGGDEIVGGPGRDYADGGKGFDRCSAERREECEA